MQPDLKQRPDILTASGTYFDFLRPEQSKITIHDIAHALSQICRFTGHCDQFYSVAQHSVLVSYHVPREHAFAALLHDAAEAYIGDISSPLKQLLPDYKAIEKRVEAAVFGAFGLPSVLPACVKEADLRALLTERRDLMPEHLEQWSCARGLEPFPRPIKPWSQKLAKWEFMLRFDELWRAPIRLQMRS